jgi:hypothetical protein
MADLDGGAGARGGTFARARARAPTPPPPASALLSPREKYTINNINFNVLNIISSTKFQVHVLILK